MQEIAARGGGTDDLQAEVLGCAGSIACPSPNHIACGGERIILDSGTGIRNLGHWLLRKNVNFATILLSHTHWDHINGFPFFSPAFRADRSFCVMAGHLQKSIIKDVFAGQINNPYFPVPLDAMKATMSFADFKAGDEFFLGRNNAVKIRTCALNHPDGATAYRIEYMGKSACYVTDTEHIVGNPNQNILGLIEGADLVIYDSTYTDKEFPQRLGWGHSTWEEGVRLCQAARAKSLAIFHHDPDHEDMFMEGLESRARAHWIGAFVAREHMRVNLS